MSRVRVRVRARVSARVRVTVRVRVRVSGGREPFLHTHAWEAGLSGMQFNEGERDLRVRVKG